MNNNNGFRPQGGQGWNQPRPYYQGGNGNSNYFNPNQSTYERTQQKLAANYKSLETIHAKMDEISTAIKNQLSFNKMLETQLAKLAIAIPSAELWKIPWQLEPTLAGSINAPTTRCGKPSRVSSFANFAEELTRPIRGPWGELVATIKEDPGTLMIFCLIFDCQVEQAMLPWSKCQYHTQGNIREIKLFYTFPYLDVRAVGLFNDTIPWIKDSFIYSRTS